MCARAQASFAGASICLRQLQTLLRENALRSTRQTHHLQRSRATRLLYHRLHRQDWHAREALSPSAVTVLRPSPGALSTIQRYVITPATRTRKSPVATRAASKPKPKGPPPPQPVNSPTLTLPPATPAHPFASSGPPPPTPASTVSAYTRTDYPTQVTVSTAPTPEGGLKITLVIPPNWPSP